MKKNLIIVSSFLTLVIISVVTFKKKLEKDLTQTASPLLKTPEQKDQGQEFEALKKTMDSEKPVVFAKEDISPEGFNFIHYDFARFLSRTVYTHNYDEFIKEDSAISKRSILAAYLKSLQEVKKATFERWDNIHQKSFLINTYHAYLIEFMMTKNFKELSEADLAKIGTVKVFDQIFSFDSFTQKELLKRFPERAIILALHCFSEFCPEYRSRVFNFKNIEQELVVAVNRYFRHPKKVLYDQANNKIILGPLLKKYQVFFPNKDQAWRDYLDSIFPEKSMQRDLIMDKKTKYIF
jgi:hypothetical protein